MPAKKKKGSGENIRVIVRTRPLKEDEVRDMHKVGVKIDVGTNQIIVQDPPGDPHIMAFDMVYDNRFTQKDIFNNEVKPLCNEVFEGYNATLFAYGQSGSGKTFSMTGDVVSKDPEKYGMMPQAVEYIFAKLKENSTPQKQYKLKASYIELYNGHVKDLLAHKGGENLDIREGPAGFFVKGILIKEVPTFQSCMDEFNYGTDRRRTAATNLNEHSSRSHSMFSLMIEEFDYEQDQNAPTVSTCKMVIVDLAGSEKLGKTGAQGETLIEGCNINASLSALGTCIDRIVTSGPHAHIPYRANKLTMLLKDSLGGNSKTCMFANCGPSDRNIAETMSTLRFADNAKKIQNKPIKNIDPMKLKIQELEATIHDLQRRLGPDYDPEKEGNLQEEIDRLMIENDALRKDSDRGSEKLEYDNRELQVKCQEIEKEMSGKIKELEETQRDREDVRSRLTVDLQHAENLRSIAMNFLRRVMSDAQIKIISDNMPSSVSRSNTSEGSWTVGELSTYFDGFIQFYEEWRNTAFSQDDLQKEVVRVKSEMEARFSNQLQVLEGERDQLVKMREEQKAQHESETEATTQFRFENTQLKEEVSKLKEKLDRDQEKFKKKLDKHKEEYSQMQQQLESTKAESENRASEIEKLKRQSEEGGGSFLGASLSGTATSGLHSPSKDEQVRKLQLELEEALSGKQTAELRIRQMNLHLRRKGICVVPGSAAANAVGIPPPPPGDEDSSSGMIPGAEDENAFVITEADGPVPDGDTIALLQQQLRVQHRLQELNHNHQKKLDLLLRKYEMVKTGQVTKLDAAADNVSSEELAAKQVELDTLRAEMDKKLEKLLGKLNKKAAEFENQLRGVNEEKQAMEEERNELVQHVEDLTKFNQQIALEIETLRAKGLNAEKESSADKNLLRSENETLRSQVTKLEGNVESNRLKVAELDELKGDYAKMQRLQERTDGQLREKLSSLERNHEEITRANIRAEQERRKVDEAAEQLAAFQEHMQQMEEEWNVRFTEHEGRLMALNSQRMQEQEAHFLQLVDEEKHKVKVAKNKLRQAKENEQRAEKRFDEMVLENEVIQMRYEDEKKTAMKMMAAAARGGGGMGDNIDDQRDKMRSLIHGSASASRRM